MRYSSTGEVTIATRSAELLLLFPGTSSYHFQAGTAFGFFVLSSTTAARETAAGIDARSAGFSDRGIKSQANGREMPGLQQFQTLHFLLSSNER